MKRTALVIAAAIIAAATNVAVARPSGTCAVPESTFLYCGDHWRGSKLPLKFRLNNAGAPALAKDPIAPSLDTAGVVALAAANWDAAWPDARKTTASGCINPTTGASMVARAICYAGTTGAGLAEDGVNAILWGSPSACPGGGGVATACVYYEGTTGEAATRIKEVDIVLSASAGRNWRIAWGADLVTGEVLGVPLGNWTDIQSVLAHEMGHALGLEHIGNSGGQFPYDLTDAGKIPETMYQWYLPGSTNKRSLHSGDLAGLTLAAEASANDYS